MHALGAVVTLGPDWLDPAYLLSQYGAAFFWLAIVIAVAHQQFKALGAAAIRALGKPEHVLFDLKYLFAAEETDVRL